VHVGRFFTVDVEIWCGGWQDIDEKFPAAYRKYIHGPTPSGDLDIPYQMQVRNDHNLTRVFFVEPLHSGGRNRCACGSADTQRTGMTNCRSLGGVTTGLSRPWDRTPTRFAGRLLHWLSGQRK
jgi:hypothetical protein